MIFLEDYCCGGVETMFYFTSAALVDAASKKSKKSELFGVVGGTVKVGEGVSTMVYVYVA